jgi:tripartite-type tricarboxylate transporter receptor subunit TctC
MLSSLLLVCGVVQALAQPDWPSRSIKLIVPFAAGGNTDILGRMLAERIERKLGASVVVENKPGAGANIGAEAAARSPGDGYTVFIGTASTHGINSTLYKKLRYDPLADFEPIVLVARSPLYLCVTAKLPIASVADLVAYGRGDARKLSFGSVGVGSPHHLAGELFKRRTGIDMTHVPSRGSSPAIADLIAGNIQLMFDATSIAQAADGGLRVLAVASRKRWSATPEVPSMTEQGIADFEVGGWFALFAPARTPDAIVGRINTEINAMLTEEATIAKLRTIGLLPAGGSVAALKAFIRDELVKWGEMVRISGATLD